MKSKEYLLIIRLKGGKSQGARLFFYTDTFKSVREKVSSCKDQFKDRYIGYTLYKNILEVDV